MRDGGEAGREGGRAEGRTASAGKMERESDATLRVLSYFSRLRAIIDFFWSFSSPYSRLTIFENSKFLFRLFIPIFARLYSSFVLAVPSET